MTEAPSERTRVKRLNKRAKYDAETVHGILDASPVCHVGYMFKGTPYVTPTLQWREGDRIYWHGSSASRMLETCVDADVCVTVTMIDGMVMARAAFHHSCNYRSVMVMGKAHIIRDPAEKEQRLKTFVDKLFPGRWDILRPPGDDEEDYALPIWAGLIPMRTEILAPIADERNLHGLSPPDHVMNFKMG
jgi:nitroimidazol reductase NimA-like FMN-containing flavoprotein (pyridoxamine 5'-phosphate oxidase superfamily)